MIYEEFPVIMPSGKSRIWLMAKQIGKYEDVLSYPDEDAAFKKGKMDKLRLQE
jgi:hypothetical protein